MIAPLIRIQMTSANVRSVFRKYLIPVASTTRITVSETRKPGQYIRVAPFSSDHRNPSIVPTIGLIEYSSRHRSGTTSLVNPTGEIYRPNCTMNGTMNQKSRYRTINAEIHKPIPNEAANAIIANSGASSASRPGGNRYQISNSASRPHEIRRSTKLVITLLAGIVTRGKYTVETRGELPTTPELE